MHPLAHSRPDTGRPRRARSAAALVGALTLLAGVLTPTAAAAADREDFTFVVIPDTQGYTVSSTLHETVGVQTRWIVDNRERLNIGFAAQVGDLVESWPNTAEWERASQHLAVLDDAGVPNSVLPGNHDMNVATGEAPTYDTHFPPSRYADASWNSETVSYGGYLGENLFGPDPVDRKNKDSFSLLDVSGLKLLVLSLEYESPQYTLDWAQKVIDAHPDRRVILATHGFIHTGGARSSAITRTDGAGLTAQQVWSRLVYDNCSIFMVVNGHWHDGDEGEAHRTDANACGKPVHQILSNYQERVNGGDGWLRYYTFKPDENSIEAVTYSPTLDRFETDADSAFTLDYEMGESATADRLLVRGGSDWRWRFDQAGWPAGWTSGSFDAAGWAAGPAPLGFGSAVATNIDVPPPTSARPRSAQFRHEFEVTDASALSDVVLTTRADDGVVVFVNGTEVGRSNLPTGALTATSYATAAPRTASAATLTLPVPATLLVDGVNVVTASTHLNYRGTPDVSFDLTLRATEALDEEPPGDPAPPEAPVLTGTTTADSAELSWTHPEPAGVTEYRVLRHGVERGVVPAPGTAYSDAGLTPDTEYRYGVVAVGPTGLSSAAGEAVLRTAPAVTSREVELVAADASWRWRFERTAWPAGWTGRQFDDSAWKTGAAALGFGTTGVATNIDVPPPTSNRAVSAQFRARFQVPDASALSELTVSARADDGVVIHVNGTEIGRRNLPTGTLTANSYAAAAPRTTAATAAPVTFPVPASLLVDGVNVISASTHLNYRGTPDVSFGLVLRGTETAAPPGEEPEPPAAPAAPTVTGTTAATAATLSWAHPEPAAVSEYRVLRDGAARATLPATSSGFSDSGLSPDTEYRYGIVAVGPTGLASAVAEVTLRTPPAATAEPQVLLAQGSTWRWYANRSGWQSGWAGSGFEDSSWSAGGAVLGFGSAVATNTDAPAPTSNRSLSTQFRSAFTIDDPAAVSQVRVTTRADDGVVVYVNGVEIGRSNLPAGTLTGTTYATAAPRTSAATGSPIVFAVPSSVLRAGQNVVAVSTHLNYRATPDTSFDLRVDAMVAG